MFTKGGEIMELYSNRLQELVHNSPFNQRRLSEELGFDESTLSLYLSGKRIPGVKNHLKICNYFNVDQNFFTNDFTKSK